MAEGRYRVIERLEAGGMAEVFLGEVVSHQGFKKACAIKRVLPHLAQNRAFMAMFLDEARLGARLSHANVVSVFDIGAADNTYFLVMEYVDGANLKTVMESLRKQGRHFPMKMAIYICMEACRGLSYAHELTGDQNEPLHIVHRDISPPNLLISKRGEVKVTDFGLAKASTQLERTDPGVVKGKFSYLAPEAALGQPTDARADVFAIGIVLWEMLAGRRLFLGETDYQTVKLVQQANVPSLQRLNTEVDVGFEEVLRRALARDPNDRYQSARELSDAFAGYLFSRQMKVTSYDIAGLIKSCLAERARASAPPREQSIIDRLIQEELLRFTSIDQMQDPLNPSGAPPPASPNDGAQPLDALSFVAQQQGGDQYENPAEWFNDDADVAAAIGMHAPAEPSSPGWHEAGIDSENPPRPSHSGELSHLLEADATGERPLQAPTLDLSPPSMPPMSSAAAGQSSRPPMPIGLQQSTPPPAQAQPPSGARPRKGGMLKYIVLMGVIVLGAVGAAAYVVLTHR